MPDEFPEGFTEAESLRPFLLFELAYSNAKIRILKSYCLSMLQLLMPDREIPEEIQHLDDEHLTLFMTEEVDRLLVAWKEHQSRVQRLRDAPELDFRPPQKE